MKWLSSTTPLKKETAVSLQKQISEWAKEVYGTVFADKAGTLHVEHSPDGENWDHADEYEIEAEKPTGFWRPVLGEHVRVRFVNGAEDQEEFRLYARTR